MSLSDRVLADRLAPAPWETVHLVWLPLIDLESLIARMASGDRRAFGLFYDRTGSFVFGLLLRMLRDGHAAEEVAQDVYVQLWRTAATFDAARSSGLAWVAMVARSRGIDRLRADSSLRTALKSAGEELAPRSGPDPAEETSLRERRARVRAAVNALPPEQREALELAFFHGLTHSEIASRTATPLGTVKTRIRAALAKLERLLAALHA